jgi:FAD/FMN-containing dehydrogenase
MTTSHSLAERLATAIPAARIATDDDSLQRYGRDWTRYTEPHASAVVFPTSTEEVAALVKLAATEHMPSFPLVAEPVCLVGHVPPKARWWCRLIA